MNLNYLRPEQQLCLTLARRSLSPELVARATFLVRKGPDWDRFLDLSMQHRMSPLFFRHLEHFEPGLVPERILRVFRMLYEANSETSDILAKELARIVQAFGKAGIPAVPFKGPLVGDLVWGDHRLWVGEDLDLLVHERDLRRAEKMLWGDGYQTVKGREEQRPRHALRGRGKPTSMFVSLRKRAAAVETLVDIQANPFLSWLPNERLYEQVWEDVRSGSVFGVPGLLLPPSWNFILLSLHAWKYQFVLLKWVSELYELWNSAGTDRDMILEKSEQVGFKKGVLLSVAVCERLLGKGSEVNPYANNVLARQLSRNVFRRPPVTSLLSRYFLRLRVQKNMIGKIRYLVVNMLAPTVSDQHLLPLPQCLHFLYYLIRPVRLALTHGLEQALERRRKLRISRRERLFSTRK